MVVLQTENRAGAGITRTTAHPVVAGPSSSLCSESCHYFAVLWRYCRVAWSHSGTVAARASFGDVPARTTEKWSQIPITVVLTVSLVFVRCSVFRLLACRPLLLCFFLLGERRRREGDGGLTRRTKNSFIPFLDVVGGQHICTENARVALGMPWPP